MAMEILDYSYGPGDQSKLSRKLEKLCLGRQDCKNRTDKKLFRKTAGVKPAFHFMIMNLANWGWYQ